MIPWLALQQADPVMDGSSWTFMIFGWASVIGLAFFCFKRVLGSGPEA